MASLSIPMLGIQIQTQRRTLAPVLDRTHLVGSMYEGEAGSVIGTLDISAVRLGALCGRKTKEYDFVILYHVRAYPALPVVEHNLIEDYGPESIIFASLVV